MKQFAKLTWGARIRGFVEATIGLITRASILLTVGRLVVFPDYIKCVLSVNRNKTLVEIKANSRLRERGVLGAKTGQSPEKLLRILFAGQLAHQERRVEVDVAGT